MLPWNDKTNVLVCWDIASQLFGGGCLLPQQFQGKKKAWTMLTNLPTLLNKQKRNSDQRQLAPSQRYLKGRLGWTEQHPSGKAHNHFESKQKRMLYTTTLLTKWCKRGKWRRLVHHKATDSWNRRGRSVARQKLHKRFWWEVSDYILTANTHAIRHPVWLTSCYQVSNKSNPSSHKGQDKTWNGTLVWK